MMPRVRFQQVRCELALYPPVNPAFHKELDPRWRCRDTMEYFQKRFAEFAVPIGVSSINEMPVRTKARTRANTYLSSKPDKYGVRFYEGKIDRVKSNDLHTKMEANIGDPTMDDEVCIREGGSLFAEDVEDQMAVLPEITATTEEVKIEDLQIGDANINTQEEIKRLVQIIWKRKHLLIGKGNALPPAAKGVPVAQRCRKVAIQFREKLHQLVKGLLSARMIRHSTSPWASSPIVVIIKKNGIDIRLCIDYRLVNSLTRLMVYPMPLVNDLQDDLDKVLWYCSLDMASGFWVVPMTDRARSISAFITPFGLFEWNRMPFGLKNAPQIYQRLLDNALYGFVKVTQDQDRSDRKDVFETGEPDLERNESVLGRRSYIDDILVTERSWDPLCEKVERLLDACDEWNLSSAAKSFWGRQKVDYLGH
ncbi:Reverse transcriptase, partial [Phytophthora palmivora]